MNNRKHGLLMLLGCGLMMVAVFFVLSRGALVNNTGASGSSWAWLLFLLCPLMHLFMMHGHNHGHNQDECHQEEHKVTGKNKQNQARETQLE